MSVTWQQWLQRHGLTAVIGGLVIGLLGVVGFETQWGNSLRPSPVVVVGQAAKGSDTSLLPAFALPAADVAFNQTVERPLFVPTRRPTPIVAGVVQPAMKKGQFKLAGTVLNQDLPFAFLVEVSTGKGMRVAKGAEIISTGISVASIDAMRVVLKQGEETEELTLRTAASPPAPIAPPPGAPVAGVPGAAQRPPPAGVVVGAIPTMPGAAAAPAAPVLPIAGGGVAATGPRAGSSVMPGWVQPPTDTAQTAAPATPPDATVGTQRRRRFPNVPQQ